MTMARKHVLSLGLHFSKCFCVTSRVNPSRYLISRTSITPSRYFSKDLSPFDPVPTPSADNIDKRLKSATNTQEVMMIINSYWSEMDIKLVMRSLKTLFSLQKSSHTTFSEEDILQSHEFLNLCKYLKKHVREVEVNDIVDALKILLYFKVPCNSIIMQHLLKILRDDINSLSLQHISFLLYLLKSFPEDAISTAMKIALPIVYETHLKTKLDLTNVGNMVEVLTFCTKQKLPIWCVEYVIEGLLNLPELDWVTMATVRARSILLSLLELKSFGPSHMELLQKAINIINHSSLVDMEQILHLCSKKAKRFPFFYNEDFFDGCANAIIERGGSFKECGFILRHLVRVGHVHYQLLDYMSAEVAADPAVLREAPFGLLVTFVSGLSVANYRPDAHWNTIEQAILGNTALIEDRRNVPWIKLVLDMAVLNIFSDPMIDKMYDAGFLEDFLNRDYAVLDLLQFLLFSQAVKTLHPSYEGEPPQGVVSKAKELNGVVVTEHPLKGALESALGGSSYVLTKCYTKSGHFIDHAVVMRKGGYPVAVTTADNKSTDRVYVEDLQLPKDSVLILMLCIPPSWHAINTKRPRGVSNLVVQSLEALGHMVVNISVVNWESLQDYEKIPYLMEAIKTKAGHLYADNEAAAVT